MGAGAHVLPKLLTSFAARCSDVRLTVQEVDTVEQVDGLRAGWLDGCLSYLPHDQPDLERHVLGHEPRVALLSDADERAGARALAVDDLVDSCWVPADPTEPVGWDAFFTLGDLGGDPGRRLPIDFTADAYAQCQQLRAFRGALVSPEHYASMADLDGIAVVPVPDAPPAPLTLALPQRRHDEPVAVLHATLSELLASA